MGKWKMSEKTRGLPADCRRDPYLNHKDASIKTR